MGKIHLTKSKFAIIDKEDLKLVGQFNWQVGFGGSGGEYAKAREPGTGRTIRMHRLIMGAEKGQEIDHINRNGLDNRRSNLRFVTRAENNRNKGLYKNNLLGVRGVSKINNKYQASLKLNGKVIYLGRYRDLNVAILARKWGEKFYFR